MDWVQELLNRKRMMAGNGMQAMAPGNNGMAAMAPQPWSNGPQSLTPPGNPVDQGVANVSDMKAGPMAGGMNPSMMGMGMLMNQAQQGQAAGMAAQQRMAGANQDQLSRVQQMAAMMRQRMGY